VQAFAYFSTYQNRHGVFAMSAPARANHPLRIVVADDHPTVLRMVRKVIEQEPHLKVVGDATDGASAAAQVRRCRVSVRVFLAEDSEIMRETIVTFCARHPEVEIVGQSADFKETLDLTAELKPDVLLMDLRMAQRVNGQTKKLKEDSCSLRHRGDVSFREFRLTSRVPAHSELTLGA
jgi:DNA-binding NarL/FixJ family response regulator